MDLTEEVVHKYQALASWRSRRGPASGYDDRCQQAILGLLLATKHYGSRLLDSPALASKIIDHHLSRLAMRDGPVRYPEGWYSQNRRLGRGVAVEAVEEYLSAPEAEEGPDLVRLNQALSTLTPREQEVIHLRFWKGLTLREVGRRLNLTSERIRQIEAEALEKLKRLLSG